MDKYEETFKTWNKIAQAYQDSFLDLDLYNDTYEIFLKYLLPNEAEVLDPGCGPGNIERFLLNKRPDLRITGIDISPNMIALARKNNPAANYQLLDIRDLTKLNKKFFAIISGFALPYLSREDCIKLFKNCNGLLLEKGIFYFSFLRGDYRNSGYYTGRTGDRVFLYYHDVPFFEKILKKEGFELLHVFHKEYKPEQRPPEIHSIIIARKSPNR